ncbi:CBO0543 family protein [Neobacillus drentensis]|uniref:CBO0543 family protein n=1 Tax=Neobacillus drentensis TaxID=220684 RepID=UPI0030028393
MLILFGIYPAATMLIINWYPFNRPLISKVSYIICWSVFSTLYEWLMLKMGYFYHDHWSIWLSAVSYPFLYGALLGNLKFIRWLENVKKV